MDKYLLTATFRADGSSRFGENNKFGYFPSAALAWRLDNEQFISSNIGLFSTLKLRASWGLTGNQDIGNYNSLTTFTPGPKYSFEGTLYNTYQPARMANPDLKWESTEQFNIGFDMGFLANRIYLTADYFRTNTTNLLMDVPIPPETGFSSVLQNVGSIRNTGLEMQISSKNTVGVFKWNTAFNFSTLKNEVTDIGDQERIISGPVIIQKGETLNSFYGWKIIGIWQEGDDFGSIDAPVIPGNLKYADIDGDGSITGEDRIILGNSFPDFSWGLSNDFSYKRFELKIFIEGEHGVSMFNSNQHQTYQPNVFRRNKLAEPLLNRWTPENPSNKYPSFVDPFTQGFKDAHSYSIEDASYVKVRYVNLSYTIPISNFRLRVYLSGENLLTFTDYTGYDPSTNPSNNPTIKRDLSAYPSTTTYLLGVQLDF
jgi:TonB-linked SusC/RagA family outer membrane protein